MLLSVLVWGLRRRRQRARSKRPGLTYETDRWSRTRSVIEGRRVKP